MISVSSGLKAEIQKLRGRRLTARVRIDYSDVSIDNTIYASSTGNQANSYIEQIYNGKEDIDAKWWSLDGSCALDGTYALAPETAAEQERYEIGWWGDRLSSYGAEWPETTGNVYGEALYGEEVYGEFSTYPEIFISFSPRTISDIRLSFDNARMEYATDFDVLFFDASETLLYTESITGNAGVKYVATVPTQNLVASMRLKIYGWSHARRQPKIAEFFTSVFELYSADDIINLNVIEARELSDQSPVGSTASGRCVVTLYNRNRRFDYDNTSSKLYNLVRENVRITPEIGDGSEWVPLGTFYAKEWDISKLNISATVTGVDMVAVLGESEYTESQIIEAPDDEQYEIDTDAEWQLGDVENVEASSNAIRLNYV
jgi:hypothetical protein